MSATTPLIRLRRVTRRYLVGQGSVTALDDIDVDVPVNDYLAVVGTSGSGKSTLMNILGCLDRPTAGRYLLAGQDVTGMTPAQLARVRNERIGFVFQAFHLLPRANALQNVMQPLVYRGVSLAVCRRRAGAALERVGLGQRLNHLPGQLSGGQRQRVAIARALVGQPDLLLADEPTGNLDSTTTADIMALFDALHAGGHTVIIVTHEARIAAHCRRVLRLADGRVQADIARDAACAALGPGHG